MCAIKAGGCGIGACRVPAPPMSPSLPAETVGLILKACHLLMWPHMLSYAAGEAGALGGAA